MALDENRVEAVDLTAALSRDLQLRLFVTRRASRCALLGNPTIAFGIWGITRFANIGQRLRTGTQPRLAVYLWLCAWLRTVPTCLTVVWWSRLEVRRDVRW